jgi:predicted DsbA family dithiol-disulfide isomerase
MVFSDYIWPWCYFITGRIEKLQANFHIDIEWKAFPLHPEIPPEGVPLERIYARLKIDVAEATARLKKIAAELGLPLGDCKYSYNSRLAQELGKWAETKGKGDEFHNAVFRAYFVDGANIGRTEVLTHAAKAVGLSMLQAGEVLTFRTFQEAVDEDWSLSRRMGIAAVPTFCLDGQAVVGAQPYEVLETFLLTNGIKRK